MVRYGRRGNSNNIGVPRQEWEDMTVAIREAGLGNSIRDALDLMRQRAMRESGEVIRVVPAAATSIQALEKVTMMSDGIDDTEEIIKCIFCLEEMAKGCEVTRMPCSHIFHGPCIQKWLKERSHMCPICRFKLPTHD
ncbi:Zinc finger, RING-type [Corchorus olitorius]|uniref:RING-type E3 ubiquitin transferase n=1 Tax=Corchorus olitorius TaxID=93759 RepID=A0A1R3IEE0_9ROSI|nr:Zinc finger, RING-type [Corchorus olitorius]